MIEDEYEWRCVQRKAEGGGACLLEVLSKSEICGGGGGVVTLLCVGVAERDNRMYSRFLWFWPFSQRAFFLFTRFLGAREHSVKRLCRVLRD